MLNELRRPSAFLPIVMSAIAFTVVMVHLALYGPAPQPDEGTAAHIWQLLMGVQLPIIFFFAMINVPRSPKPTAFILALQIAAGLLAAAPVFLLHW